MKSLIVPTDFSYRSFHAARYAVRLAGALQNCTVVLYHTISETGQGLAGDPAMSARGLEARLRMRSLEDYLEPFRAEGTRIIPVINSSPLIEGLLEEYVRAEAGMLVVGIKSHSVLNNLLFGNTLTAIIERAAVPALFVPELYPYADIRLSVLAFRAGSPLPAAFILTLMKMLSSRLCVFSVLAGKERAEKKSLKNNGLSLASIDAGFHTVHSDQVAAAIERFAAGQHANLLITVHHKRKGLTTLFDGSISNGLLERIAIPLLVLPEEIAVQAD